MLRADVPVGAYLSGGLDSSFLSRLALGARDGEFRTFSIGFEDEEFDESAYQRLMAKSIGAAHEQFTISRSDIARVFPDVVYHAERPILRTAPAPLFLLSGFVRDAGIKCVLTGEGADEMLEGYDIFRETKIRMFMARQPGSTVRPKLFGRLYPYLARSPQQSGGLAVDFWRKGLEDADKPGFSHQPRWTTTAALKRFFSQDVQQELAVNRPRSIVETLPEASGSWDPLARAEYLEVVSLLSGYLLSSQGDRMMMAHSVEGRFPYLDSDVMEFCNSLPVEYKLIGLNEKNILKRAARGYVPEEIIRRKKQPYRAPDAVSFLAGETPAYVEELLSERMLQDAGIFNPAMVHRLYRKCLQMTRTGTGDQTLGNSDNMAIVGILSTQLLHHLLIREPVRQQGGAIRFTTDVDRCTGAIR
jgi:asparagine synthase (glutamine-hydrolysing)